MFVLCEGNVYKFGIFKFVCLIFYKFYDRFFKKKFLFFKKNVYKCMYFFFVCLKWLWYVWIWFILNVKNKVKIFRSLYWVVDVYWFCVFF